MKDLAVAITKHLSSIPVSQQSPIASGISPTINMGVSVHNFD